jgi:hypothetical protein
MTFANVVSSAPVRHEDVWGNGGIATLILKLGPRWGEYAEEYSPLWAVGET